jgi:6-phosphogluconolactonase
MLSAGRVVCSVLWLGCSACVSAQLLVTTNSNGVTLFNRDVTSGNLTVAGSPLPAGISPASTVFDPTGRFFYAADPTTNSIYGYELDDDTLEWVPLQGSPFKDANGPTNLTMTPGGALFVGNKDGTISEFQLSERGSGTLHSLGEPLPVLSPGAAPSYYSSDGKTAFIADRAGNMLTQYHIQRDPLGPGYKLLKESSVATGMGPTAVTAGGYRQLYVSNSNGTVSVVSYGPRGLMVTATVQVGPSPLVLAATPSALYVGMSGGIGAFQINPATGALTAVAGSPFRTSGNAVQLKIDPQAQRLYALFANAPAGAIYTINNLALAQTGTFPAGPNATSLGILPRVRRITSLKGDDSDGALWSAITQANKDGEGILVFNRKLSGAIVLERALPMLAKSLSLIGRDCVTISGDRKWSGLNVTAPWDVVISEMTIRDTLGAGIAVNNSGLVTIFKCNISGSLGSAVNVAQNRSAIIANCAFSKNAGQLGGAGNFGGGSKVEVTDTWVCDNTAGDGAGFYNNGNLILRNVFLDGNIASRVGGGIENRIGSARLINTTLLNGAAPLGGAFANIQGGSATILYSTFIGNKAGSQGDALYADNASPSLVFQGNLVAGSVAGAPVPGNNFVAAASEPVATLAGAAVALPGSAALLGCDAVEGAGYDALGFGREPRDDCGANRSGYSFKFEGPASDIVPGAPFTVGVQTTFLGGRDFIPSKYPDAAPIPVTIAASDSCSLDGTASDVADSMGQANFSIRMSQPGLCTVKASGPAGFTAAVYRVYSFASPVSMTIVSGDSQVSSGEDFPIPLTVRVAGANGPQRNVPVQFETGAGAFLGGVTSSHGRTSTVLTDANGDAAVFLGFAQAFTRLPSKLKAFGPLKVKAFIPGTPGTQVSFTETVDCRRLDSGE